MSREKILLIPPQNKNEINDNLINFSYFYLHEKPLLEDLFYFRSSFKETKEIIKFKTINDNEIHLLIKLIIYILCVFFN